MSRSDHHWVLDNDGHLAEPATWSPEFAQVCALKDAVSLTDDHWWLIRWVRDYWLSYGNPPLMRTTVQALRAHKDDSRLGSAALYALFSDHPIRQACRYGGVPKPDWCI